MSDAAPSLNLHSLEQDLQNRLHAEPANTQPVQVRCVFKEGILIVLVQHGSPALPYPRRVFRSIRQFLLESDVLDQHQVLMYLRVEGTNQPYAFHTLTEQSAAPTPVSEEENEPVAESEPIEDLTAEAEEEFDDGYEDEEDIADFEEPAFAIADEDEEEDEELDSIGGFEVEPDDELDDDYDEDEDIGFEGFTSFEDGEADDYAGDEVGDRRLSKATMAFAACLALAFSGTAFYVLTRPCVIDGCQTMSNADQLGDKSLKTFQGNPSGQEILTAQEQLDQTIDQLESIPFWSPRYTEAQSKLKDYRELSGSLDKIIESLFKASGAAQMSQNPPFPSEKWTEIAMEWETAIAGLSEIPPQDFYHSFAQSKIDGYEQNLKAINQRLAMEENSVVTLAEAKEDAKAAEVQQGVAQTLDSWEQAYLSWSAAIQKLESIPAGTTAYEEAQKLIVTYEPQMTDSKKNQDNEVFAREIYNQGLRIAQLARDAEISEDWEQATFHWRNAVRYMQEVPIETYQATLAQPAIGRFSDNVDNSRVQFQLYTRLKQAETDLQRTCAGDPNICTFTLDARNINVRLTAAYVNEVQETAVQASATNNSDAKIRILDHIATLEQALEVISKNTNVPVQVYDVNGVLLVDYKP